MRDLPPKRQENPQEKQGAHKKFIRKGVPGGRQHEVFVGNITNTLKEVCRWQGAVGRVVFMSPHAAKSHTVSC